MAILNVKTAREKFLNKINILKSNKYNLNSASNIINLIKSTEVYKGYYARPEDIFGLEQRGITIEGVLSAYHKKQQIIDKNNEAVIEEAGGYNKISKDEYKNKFSDFSMAFCTNNISNKVKETYNLHDGQVKAYNEITQDEIIMVDVHTFYYKNTASLSEKANSERLASQNSALMRTLSEETLLGLSPKANTYDEALINASQLPIDNSDTSWLEFIDEVESSYDDDFIEKYGDYIQINESKKTAGMMGNIDDIRQYFSTYGTIVYKSESTPNDKFSNNDNTQRNPRMIMPGNKTFNNFKLSIYDYLLKNLLNVDSELVSMLYYIIGLASYIKNVDDLTTVNLTKANDEVNTKSQDIYTNIIKRVGKSKEIKENAVKSDIQIFNDIHKKLEQQIPISESEFRSTNYTYTVYWDYVLVPLVKHIKDNNISLNNMDTTFKLLNPAIKSLSDEINGYVRNDEYLYKTAEEYEIDKLGDTILNMQARQFDFNRTDGDYQYDYTGNDVSVITYDEQIPKLIEKRNKLLKSINEYYTHITYRIPISALNSLPNGHHGDVITDTIKNKLKMVTDNPEGRTIHPFIIISKNDIREGGAKSGYYIDPKIWVNTIKKIDKIGEKFNRLPKKCKTAIKNNNKLELLEAANNIKGSGKFGTQAEGGHSAVKGTTLGSKHPRIKNHKRIVKDTPEFLYIPK